MKKSVSPLVKQPGMNSILLSFLLGMLGALAILLPFLIVDKGFFLYCGDYNAQQIPFYMYVQQFIKNGGGTWSWATDIGSSVITSYSFYNIGSPFLWLTMLFPSRWMPYLMVPLFMLKFGGIAAAANLYLSRYTKNRNISVICSVVYAFAGFNVYNIFFNHMLDPVVLFPLMLWALDGFVYEKKRGWFALFLGLGLLNSYFFFIGNAVFLVIYFVVKVVTREYRINGKEFGLLAIETVLGIGIGMALALPSFYSLLGNPRTSDFASGFNIVMFWNVQQYFNIFASLFLPPDPPYMPNLFTEGAIKWTSMSAFLPIVSVAGVAAYCKSRKKTATKIILFICLIMALVPFLNSSFYAFNASYYARWFYMPLLIMCFATMRSLEDEDIDLAWGAKFAVILTGLYVIFGLLPTQKDGEWTVGVAEYPSKFWTTVITALIGVGVFYFLVHAGRKQPHFARRLLAAVMAFSVLYSVIHISLGKFPQWYNDADYRTEQYYGTAELELPEEDFYRIDAYQCYENLGLWMDRSCLQTFNSTVSSSIMEFYPMVGVKRDVSSKPERDKYALRGLLSVKYTVMPIEERAAFERAGGEHEMYGNLGWTFYKEQGPFAVYENENFVPLGFTYDEYINMDYLTNMAEDDRSLVLMRGIGLSAEQINKYSYLYEGEAVRWEVPEIPDATFEENWNSGWYAYEPVGYDAYVQDAADRRASASYDVQADSSGFTCKINMDRENLVFFAVPYDEGFTATVNGHEAEVMKVSGGMMAVYAPAGDNEIVFRYATPGFRQGVFISLSSLIWLAVYVLWCQYYKRKKALVPVGVQVTDDAAGKAAPAPKLAAREIDRARVDTGPPTQDKAGGDVKAAEQAQAGENKKEKVPEKPEQPKPPQEKADAPPEGEAANGKEPRANMPEPKEDKKEEQ